MQTRLLGRTRIEVSGVGFGSWGLGGDFWRGTDREEGKGALIAALEAGVTLIDTALVYGHGESERLIAEVLADVGAAGHVAVATKIPPLDGRWPPDPSVPLEQVFPVSHIERAVDQSLQNLGAEAIAVEQLHVWLDDWLDQPAWPELADAMERLVRAGKVLHWGISVNDHAPETALRAIEQPMFETVQVIYNVFDRSAEAALLPRAAAARTGVIARCPFDEGALVGAVRADTVFEPGDFRHEYFRGDRKAQAAERADRLRELLGAEAHTLAELALRFCLSRGEVSSVIPGMRRAAHVRSNTAVADGRALSPALLARLAEHAWDKNWYAWNG